MSKLVTLVSGVGIGAGLMMFFDPIAGRRRRAMLRDNLVHGLHETRDSIDETSSEVSNRVRGVGHQMGAEVHGNGTQRRRMSSGNGHSRPGNTSETTGPQTSAQGDLSAQTRLLAGATGGIFTLYGIFRRGFIGTAVGLTGLSLLVQGVTGNRLSTLLQRINQPQDPDGESLANELQQSKGQVEQAARETAEHAVQGIKQVGSAVKDAAQELTQKQDGQQTAPAAGQQGPTAGTAAPPAAKAPAPATSGPSQGASPPKPEAAQQKPTGAAAPPPNGIAQSNATASGPKNDRGA